MASMVLSLRIHLFEHGTIPTWNFLLCGGRPELAVPSSWAWGWPSLFAYALSPNVALLAVWVILTLIGGLAMRALLLRWTGVPLAANAGACLYALNGYFGARFFAGQVSFAFFHLVPVLMLVYERAFDGEIAGRRGNAPLVVLAAVSFLFFSAGLPHALFHAYPIFLLLVVFRLAVASGEAGWRRALGATGTLLVVHLLGASLAAYKIWPAVHWQLGRPRPFVETESYSLWQVLENTLAFIPDYRSNFVRAWHKYPSIGSNAFVGPGPWLAAAAVLLAAIWRWKPRPRRARAPGQEPASDRIARGLPWLGLALVAAGLSLALGTAHPWGPARLFPHLPLVSGIRETARYQMLTIFGLSILVAVALGRLSARRDATLSPLLAAGLFLAICAPAAVQASILAWNVRATPNREIERRYPDRDPQGPPEFIGAYQGPALATDHTAVLLSRGWWIANCLEDLQLPVPRVVLRPGHRAPLSSPPPARLVRLRGDSVTLAYPPGLRQDVAWRAPTLATFRYNVAPRGFLLNRPVFPGGDIEGGEITIQSLYPGPPEGARASFVALGLAVVFFAGRRARGRRG
jgi:hypothetical protein